ncbi:hypothetical protein [Longimicrobium sp.]|uniref:hypothetical protein n=1 Tax=Longimicrobium sp. TaxID=2029185 RepID=UPI002BFF5F52|nr:hypothetical protein [Longimicrobium sp.]HSU15716.1 hypothetical protein [Longimicrobium sp.]
MADPEEPREEEKEISVDELDSAAGGSIEPNINCVCDPPPPNGASCQAATL